MTRRLTAHFLTAIFGAAIALFLVGFGALSIGAVSAHSDSGLGCIDANSNGVIDRSEVITVIRAYLTGSHPCPQEMPAPGPDEECTIDETVDLGTTECANLWVDIFQDPDLPKYLRVDANSAFDVGVYELTVFVDDSRYCNPSRMYADEDYYELSCEFEEKHHTSVQGVSAQTSDLGDLRCERNFQSTSSRSLFACVWR